jgi:hypothetical protein
MEKKFSEKMKNKFFERKIIIFDTISITCYLSFLIRSIFQTVGCKKKKKKKKKKKSGKKTDFFKKKTNFFFLKF